MKRFLIFFFSLLILFYPIKETYAQSEYSPRTVKVVTLAPETGESKSFYTVWGEVVEIKNEVNGDVYVAANQVILDGVVNGDLIAIGGEIVINGVVNGNLRAVAESIVLSGKVEENMTVLGSVVDISPDSSIEGGLIALSERIMLRAPVVGQVKLLAEVVNLESFVGSDAEIWAKSINISSGASLSNLTYYSENNAEIDKDATISGTLLKRSNGIFEGDPDFSGMRSKFGLFSSKLRFATHIFSFLWALAWGLLILRLFPVTLGTVISAIEKNILKSLVLGFLTIILVPISIIILMVSLIGIPAALVLMTILGIISYLAKIFVSFWIGQKLIKDENKAYLSMVLGLFIYYLLAYQKYFGGVFVFFVLLLGFGGGLIGLYTHYKNLGKRKII